MAAALAACQAAAPPGTIGSVEGFAGAAAADEPRAVLIARDVLGAGGSAADAAVALYFALAVTMPSTAGLGGGGVCVVHDRAAKRTLALDFLPRAAPEGGVALPGNVRGMALLHARYGRLAWAELVIPAERLARFGTPVSRALARELATAEGKLLVDPETRRIFTGTDGRLLDEGDGLRQVELATTLGQIRQKGAGVFYAGPLAQTLAEAARSIGVPLTVEALRATMPELHDTVQVAFGNHNVHFAPPPAAGGLVAAQLFAMMAESPRFADVAAEPWPHLLVEASKRAFAERSRWMRSDGSSAEPWGELVSAAHAGRLMQSYDDDRATPPTAFEPPPIARPENPWAAGFVVVDADGGAVACNVTLNDLFGSGRMAPGTGILLAPAPNEQGAGAVSLGPMIMANAPTGEFYYAAAGSGGPTAPTALIAVFLRSVVAGEPLETAMRVPRLHHNGAPDVVFHEADAAPTTLAALTRRGHGLRETGILGRVNAIWCADALPRSPRSCQAQTDPRGSGLAILLAE